MDKQQLLKEAGLFSREELFKSNGLVMPREPRREFKYVANEKMIDEKRAELELRKLEIEIAKLEQPNTNIDYFKQMLDLQQSHFNQLLAMQKDQSSLMLEIEKLKMGGDSDDSMMFMLDMIKPILPQILAKKSEEATKGVSKRPMDKELYVKGMQDGSITVEMGYEDFKVEFPELAAKMSFDDFKVQFEKIKASGLPKV